MKNKLFGNITFYKEVMAIILPIMAQQIVESLVELIDNVMIGRIGSAALTGVTVANKYFFLYNSALFGLGGAATIFIAQYFGAKESKKCQQAYNAGLLFSMLFGLLFMIIIMIYPKEIIQLFTTNKDIVKEGCDYLHYLRYSFIPYGISMITMMALRPVGINKVQLKIVSTAVITNSILNYILIFGHLGFSPMGTKGAAIATLIARILEMSIYLVLLFKKKYFFKLDLYGMLHLDLELCKQMVIKAIPLTINEILFTLANTLVYKAYMRVDEIQVAAISVVDSVLNLAFITMGGLSNAVSIMIGNRLGANELEEAKDNALKLLVFGILIALLSTVILWILAPLIPYLYNLEEEVNTTITALIRLDGINMPAYIINSLIFFILRAGGDTLSTLIMDSGYLWLINVSISTILSLYTNLSLVTTYAIVEGLNWGKSILAIYFYKKGKWIRNITEQ